ncbi:hypothetical protein HGRIS_005640 [Hohenbuehelia grisea]|uniref:Protein kinase domain-containing protein n=1 Tax=Hohenbuehelia grisea TaxID=104357 RepID=A0ABR3JZA3_9AGAR
MDDITHQPDNNLVNIGERFEVIRSRAKIIGFRRQLRRIISVSKHFGNYLCQQSKSDGLKLEFAEYIKDFEAKSLKWSSVEFRHGLAIFRLQVDELSTKIKSMLAKAEYSEFRELNFDVEAAKDWEDIIPQLEAAVTESFPDHCRHLQGDEAEAMMVVLQKMLDCTAPEMKTTPSRNHAFRSLKILATIRGEFVLTDILCVADLREVASGGYGIVYSGTCNKQRVAVKKMRVSHDEENESKAFRREVLHWRQLSVHSHPNIMPLLGLTSANMKSSDMIMPWCDNGHLLQYVNGLEKEGLIVNRAQLLVGTCQGLEFLHNHIPQVIHSDLKCANVMVSADGTPLLSDFGVAASRGGGASLTSMKDHTGGTLNWMAVELFSLSVDRPIAEMAEKTIDHEQVALKVTTFSDIWSFAMLMLELFTGMMPFPNSRGAGVVVLLQDGKRPEPPSAEARIKGLHNKLWKLMYQCWKTDPGQRPSLEELRAVLERSAAARAQLKAIEPSKNVIEAHLSIPPGARGLVVGKNGHHIRRLQSEYAVNIKVDATRVTVTGYDQCRLKAACDEIKERIGVDTVTRTLPVNSEIHPALIGERGIHIRHFQDKYDVHVRFEGEEAKIRGNEAQVESAIRELAMLAQKTSLEWKFTADGRLAQRLQHEKPRFLRDFSLGAMYIAPANDLSATSQQLITLKGTRAALNKTRAEIDLLRELLSKEFQLELSVKSEFVGRIVGPHWDNWDKLVTRCGGPSDRALQKDIIDIARAEDTTTITLRSTEKELLYELAAKIQQEVPNVYGVRISRRHHRHIRSAIGDIERETSTSIFCPSHPGYADCGDPMNWGRMQEAHPGLVDVDVIKVIACSPNAFFDARNKLKDLVQSLYPKQVTLSVPSKYRHALFNAIRPHLEDLKVDLDENPKRWEAEYQPFIQQDPLEVQGFSWDLVERYNTYDTASENWTLRATTSDSLHKAKALVRSECNRVALKDHAGYLSAPSSSRFGLLVGPNAENLLRLQQESDTIIQIPPKDSSTNTIVIFGSAKAVLKAKQIIVAILCGHARPREF